MKQHVTCIFKFFHRAVWAELLQLDEPFSSFIMPIATNYFSIESHVPSQSEAVANAVKIGEDIGRIGEKSWPVGLSTHVSGLLD
jgi:hypothetical protein